MKLWSKGNTAPQEVQHRIEEFTAGEDRHWDAFLAVVDVQGSIAHVNMLAKQGLLSEADHAILIPALQGLLELAKQGKLHLEEGVEDIHSQVELMLTRELGEVGKKIHAARSRNDQVLVDLKLYLREELLSLETEVQDFAKQMLALSEKHKDVLLPGYTHYQVAMPSSFGLWFASWAECLAEDLWQVHAAVKLVNKNPLGSAAGFGSSFPIDREQTTQELGFSNLHWNVLNAQMSRGRTEKSVATALAALGFTLGRMSQDIVLYLSQNFGFLRFPSAYTTGSSIMPHKKNPDVFELMRARCNRLQSLPNELALIQANLSTGYHRDLQIMKEHLFPALQELKSCFNMAGWMLEVVEVSESILSDEKYRYLFTVEAVNQKVLEGMAFRDAYVSVGQTVEAGKFEWNASLKHSHQGSLGNLCNGEIERQLNEVSEAIAKA
ncbi:MAG: argininosuccinate lyase [Bacteroidetes bacterium]|nr:MAG: argininosuccinate lyase [Bacteroidota bacterium]